MWDLPDLRRALSIEQQHALEPIIFRVVNVRQVRGLLRLEVVKKPGRASAALDESLEDAAVRWAEKDNGGLRRGIVRMANPDDSEIVIQTFDKAAITPDTTLWVYPVDFLRALREAWECDDRSGRALSVVHGRSFERTVGPRVSTDLPLRQRQREAVSLSDARVGLLHGPPGTGKTYTLGVNIARLLIDTRWRVLITATTNTAVDQALIATDHALTQLGRDDLRKKLARIGSGFDPSKYDGRSHLLPASNSPALQELLLLKAAEPDKKDVEQWIEWRERERALRARLRVDVSAVFGGARVVAATATSIFYNLAAYDAVPWNFLVVDEASQLPAASAAMVATLADRVLFAGDPKQLPAVVQSEHPLCKRYLMQTAFDVFERHAPSVRLNEQSRMAPDICELVSQAFYRGELKVAQDTLNDATWHDERRIAAAEFDHDSAIHVRRIDKESQWSPKYQGKIRYASAVDCVAVAQKLVNTGIKEEDIWVLTPYRAQRAFLRNILYAQGLKAVAVSTVHRAQGGERRVVLFDPVEAGGKFLNGELGDRLLNVALSRAMARVFVFLSEGDVSNRKVAQIVALAESIRDPASRLAEMSLADLLRLHGVGAGAIGKVIRIGNTVGEVKAFERSGEVILVRCRQTGDLRRFKVRMAA